MSWIALIAVLLAFVFLPAIVDVFVLNAPSDFLFPDQESVNVLVIGKLVALAIVVLTISLLRWWPEVLTEKLRVRRWVWIVPIAYLVVSLALTDYTRLSTAGLAVSLTLLLGTMLIAASEELLFRGVVLRFMRDRYREVIAALATSFVFGLSHIVAGPVNVVVSALFGYLLYYVRRVSGGIVVPIVVHGLYDFSVFSSATTAAPDDAANASPALVVLTFILLIVMAVGHKWAEPALQTEGG
jgi:membrane protease YdiL (CAAX protease family)